MKINYNVTGSDRKQLVSIITRETGVKATYKGMPSMAYCIDGITVEKDGDTITVTRPNDNKENRSLHGLSRTIIANMVNGVNEPFKKELEVNGVGYRAEMKGKDLVLKVGYSHDVIMTPPEGVTVEVPNPNKIVISGADKQKVGQFAANVREKRPPEPYKGKGIKYAEEHIRRKEGKAGKGGK